MDSRDARQAGSVAREDRRRGAALHKGRLSAESKTPRSIHFELAGKSC
jgi:hypothetical protein